MIGESMIVQLPDFVLDSIVNMAYRSGKNGRNIKSITIITPQTASQNYLYVVDEFYLKTASEYVPDPYVIIK